MNWSLDLLFRECFRCAEVYTIDMSEPSLTLLGGSLPVIHLAHAPMLQSQFEFGEAQFTVSMMTAKGWV